MNFLSYKYFHQILTYGYKNSKIRIKKTFKNFAKFKGLNTTVGYNFTIYSTNIKGSSIEHSTLNVPSESESKYI